MTIVLRTLVTTVAFIYVAGVAAAQQPAAPAANDQQKAQQSTEPGRAGTIEPGSAPSAAPQDTAAFVNGHLAAPGAPADSQTVPAKFSERNAALDRLPTMAFPLPLTDAQKARIQEALTRSNAPVADVRLRPADQVPSSVALREMPQALSTEIPEVSGYHYVRTPDGILLVRAPVMTVVGELSKSPPNAP
jgi:hypothetical protein